MDAKLDDVKFYDYARSPAQVIWDYNRGSPILLYKLDEGTGTTIYNSARNHNGDALGNNGTLSIGLSGSQTTTAAAWSNGSSGVFNSGLSFDGTDDYITVGDNDYLDFPDSFTIATWVNINSFPGSGNYETIITKDQTIGNEANYYLEINDANDFNCGFYGGGSYRDHEVTTPDLSTGVWYNLACVFDNSANTFKIYLNGEEVYSATENNNPTTNTRSVEIGRIPSDSQYFHGLIDDLRLYNYALSGEQVRESMNSGTVSFR